MVVGTGSRRIRITRTNGESNILPTDAGGTEEAVVAEEDGDRCMIGNRSEGKDDSPSVLLKVLPNTAVSHALKMVRSFCKYQTR